ncbi:porin [Sulfurimonas sp. HSL1-2]|uniref:porin n=1 Tax=Thiomicrolovo zhangzhouensis TaxID=3131933 RepID=UPI0031F8AFF6
MKRLKVQGVLLFSLATVLAAQDDIAQMREEITALKTSVAELQRARETNADAAFMLSGYAAAGYVYSEHTNGGFDLVQFSPIFQYAYKDLVLFTGELETKMNDDLETSVELEYASASIFLNDYMVLVAGKFLSPLGQFRQNLHPSWINKLPTEPIGFGEDGAAPISFTGLGLRGGLPLGALPSNYTLFVANAPVLELSDDNNTTIGAIAAEGPTSSDTAGYTVGLRYAVDPLPNCEIGVSGAYGKAALEGESKRDYSVFDADLSWHYDGADLKAEYSQQKVGKQNSSIAPDAFTWKAWYAQLAYQFDALSLEPVVRYGAFRPADSDLDRDQVSVGLNYLFAPSVIAKVAYEFNNADKAPEYDDNRVLAQFAFGF